MRTRDKQERIIEAVRQGLQGDAAVKFVCLGGFMTTGTAIAHHLRVLGGRGKIRQLIRKRLSNEEILDACLAGSSSEPAAQAPPKQTEFLTTEFLPRTEAAAVSDDSPLYDTTKLTLRLPSDLYEAIRMAAKAENKTHNQLIVEILTTALSRMPEPL